jgi:hypothetical protein
MLQEEALSILGLSGVMDPFVLAGAENCHVVSLMIL